MDKQAFKQRMQNLKSYRENNPGKGYWDWKVQAYQNGGDIPLWQQYQYSGPSYQDVLDDLKQNSPSTYNQLQQSKAADSQSSSEIVRYVDSKGRLQSTSNLQGLSPVITSDYLPGIGDAMEITQIVQDVKNEDYGAALAGLGLLALPGNWYGKKGLVNSIYNNVAPESYYDSYIPGGSKKDELKGALKDYLLGKGDKIDPKWENWINSPTTLGSFIAKDNKKQQHMLDVMTANTWHEGVGHMVGDNTPAILNASPNVRISNPDSSYEDYVNQANEKHAQTWDFRGNNSNLKDDQGNYYDITSYVNMVEPEFVKDPDAFARIKPAKSGKKISLSEDNITKPEDFPTGLIRHEIGHYVDEMAYPGGVPNNAYLRQLGKPSKYRPFEEVKDIFRSPDKALQDYRYLRNPTEKKSIMNQFDEYLMNNYTPSTYPQTTKEFKEAIEKAPDIHRNMKLLLKIHNKPSILFKDFKNRPLVNNTTKDKNKELV